MSTKMKRKRLRRLPHQQFAVEQLCNLEWLLVEYGTGTGKTRCITDTCKILVEVGDVPIIVAPPNSLMEQTYQQFQKWCGKAWTREHVNMLDSRYNIYRRREELKRGNSAIYLLSHESFSYKEIREGIYYRQWAAAFIDEASRFRNYSKRTQTLKALGSRAASRYAFTGNLMVRVPTDVFYVMDFLSPGIFGTRNVHTFRNTYCLLGGYMGNVPVGIAPHMKDHLLAIMDANRIKCELRDIRELPPRELRVYKVEMPKAQREAYAQMRDELKVEIERVSEPEFQSEVRTYAARLQRLQEIAAGFARNLDKDVVFLPSPKTSEAIEIIQDSTHVPTIVWYWWIPEKDRIITEFTKHKIPYSLLGQPGAVDDFMSGRTNVFLAQLAKGGYGLNLPRAMREIYHSLPWDLDVYTQSQERNMRLDTVLQEGIECMEIIHIVCHGSADEYVRYKLLDRAGISSQLSRSQALELLRGHS